MLPVKLNLRQLLFRDPETICYEWSRHFASLYADTECNTYDTTHYKIITNTSNRLKEESIIVDGDHISQDEILCALSTITTGKICGIDRVCNEHLIYGGLMVKHYLIFLFDLMYCNSHVPTALMRGIY